MQLPSLAGEVAKVGTTSISTETVRQTVARNGYNVFDEASVKKGLDDAIQFELFAFEAKKLGLDNDPLLARQIKELLVQKLISQKVDATLSAKTFSDDEPRGYYNSHTNEFRRPAIAKGYVLTVLIGEGKADEAKAKAENFLAEWKDTTKPDAVVKQYSDDAGERVSGGLSNFFVEGQAGRRYPLAVEEGMLALKLRGEFAGPITTSRANYFIRLAERRDSQPTAFEQVRAEIHRRLLREERQKLLSEYGESLKKEIPVTVDEAQLKAAVETSKPGGGPPSIPADAP